MRLLRTNWRKLKTELNKGSAGCCMLPETLIVNFKIFYAKFKLVINRDIFHMEMAMTKLYYAVISFIILLNVSLSYANIPEIVLNQKRAVVTVYVNDKDGKHISTGSGFIIGSNGIIVTNYHVISKCMEANNTLIVKMENGAFFPLTKIVNYDEENDVAVFKVDGKELPTVNLAKNYKPKQGESIVVIGSPLGLETTVSDGIISSIRGKDGIIQITAPVSPGSSGSPIFNLKGEVVGVATFLIEGGQNLNFSIPVKHIEDLLKGNRHPKKKRDDKTSTDSFSLVSYIPPDFQKTLEISSSKATSWTWRPGKNVICIVELIKAVNGMPFLQMATIMLSKNTYANLDSKNYNEYNGKVFLTQLELTGYDNAGNIHYKQHQSTFDLAQMPIYEKMPIIRNFWKRSNEKSVFENSEIALALIQLESFSIKRGENNNYICPIGTEFKLNNFLFHNIAFKLNRIGNTSEFTPSFVSIEIKATMKGE